MASLNTTHLHRSPYLSALKKMILWCSNIYYDNFHNLYKLCGKSSFILYFHLIFEGFIVIAHELSNTK